MFDKEKLQSDAIRLSSIYASSEPFPNIVVDNFYPTIWQAPLLIASLIQTIWT